MQSINQLDKQKNRERHDQESDYRVDEVAVSENRGGFLRVREIGVMLTVQCVEVICQIAPVRELADGRHDDVIHQGIDNRTECTADDYCNCEVDHIASHGKGLEFLQQGHKIQILAIVRWEDPLRTSSPQLQ